MKKRAINIHRLFPIIILLSPFQNNTGSNYNNSNHQIRSPFVQSQLSPWYNFYRRNEDKLHITDGLLPMLSCPYGHYRDYSKGVKLDGCVKCPMGYYGNSTDLHSKNCTAPCPIGSYLDKEGGKSVEDCKLCPEGTFGEEEGLTDDKCSGRCSVLNSWMSRKSYYSNEKGLSSRKRKFYLFFVWHHATLNIYCSNTRKQTPTNCSQLHVCSLGRM